jgi:hypothetical protein
MTYVFTCVTGMACNDGNPCTTKDTCDANFVCVGAPVVCTQLDQCHGIGTCNPATGICSNPNLPDGTFCNDANACTQTDACQQGVCTGTNPVTCTAMDHCHSAGVCNPLTGVCTNPSQANGTSCDDMNACTTVDACQAGVCTGMSPVMCTAMDQCHDVGTCDPTTGACTDPSKMDGSTCDDGDKCTQTDTCQGGECKGTNPVTCSAMDACHLAGTCDPASGTCSTPAALLLLFTLRRRSRATARTGT